MNVHRAYCKIYRLLISSPSAVICICKHIILKQITFKVIHKNKGGLPTAGFHSPGRLFCSQSPVQIVLQRGYLSRSVAWTQIAMQQIQFTSPFQRKHMCFVSLAASARPVCYLFPISLCLRNCIL